MLVRKLRSTLERNTASIPLSVRLLFSPVIERSAEELSYWRLVKGGFKPSGIIDVGACDGKWTEKARSLFPHCPILMVEAQESKRSVLEKVGASTGASLAITALADKAGKELVFYEMGTGSSLLPEVSQIDRVERLVVTRTLDQLASEFLPLLEGLFVKVDVQGAELMVLEGGTETLERTDVLQLEMPFVQFNEGAPDLPSILSWLNERDFVPFDIAGTHRPDGILTVQIDLLFVRRSSPLRSCYLLAQD